MLLPLVKGDLEGFNGDKGGEGVNDKYKAEAFDNLTAYMSI